MTQARKNFMIGLTSLVAVTGLVVLMFLFGELETWLKPRYTLTLNCTNAGGLRVGSIVELNGVPVGVVEEIKSNPSSLYPVRVLAGIDQDVLVPNDVTPYATSSLLGGSASLQLEGFAATGLPVDGSARIDGQLRSRLIEQFTREIDVRMAPLAEALQQFAELATNLNDLVRPAETDGDLRNVRTALDLLYDVLVDVQTALNMATAWLGDDELRLDARTMVSGAAELIERATETLDLYASLAKQLEANAATITTRLMPVMDQLAVTLVDVRRLTHKAVDGDGTVAQLLNNPDLYRSLEDAAISLEQTLVELQLLLEKINREGVRAVY